MPMRSAKGIASTPMGMRACCCPEGAPKRKERKISSSAIGPKTQTASTRMAKAAMGAASHGPKSQGPRQLISASLARIHERSAATQSKVARGGRVKPQWGRRVWNTECEGRRRLGSLTFRQHPTCSARAGQAAAHTTNLRFFDAEPLCATCTENSATMALFILARTAPREVYASVSREMSYKNILVPLLN